LLRKQRKTLGGSFFAAPCRLINRVIKFQVDQLFTYVIKIHHRYTRQTDGQTDITWRQYQTTHVCMKR